MAKKDKAKAQKIVNLFSPDWNPSSGYGRLSLELALHLTEREGYHVNCLGGNPLEFEKRLSVFMVDIVNKPIKPTLGGIVLGYPTVLDGYGEMLTAGKILIHTMFESTQFPKDWTENLNRCAAISVPARWLTQVMIENGVDVSIPLEVHPLGVSNNFHFYDRKKMPFPEQFTFLTIGDRGMRKGWDAAVKAFVRLAGDADNWDQRYKLIIKARSFNFVPNHPGIEVLEDDLDDRGMQALFERVHWFVFPSRGEGLGLPPREAAVTGLLPICTDWSGLADDLPAWGYKLRYNLVKAWEGHPQMEGLGVWAEPDIDHLVELMRWAATKERWQLWHGNWRGRQDERVAYKIRKLYRWDHFGQKMTKLWERINL